MRGSVSAGMCLALEAAGLIPAFDRIYGCSAGALSGAFAAAGQARLGATTYQETASRRFIDARRLVRGQPLVDLDLVFDELLARKRDHSAAPAWQRDPISARWRPRRAPASCVCCPTSGTQPTPSALSAQAARWRC